jgi:hypothetical protein
MTDDRTQPATRSNFVGDEPMSEAKEGGGLCCLTYIPCFLCFLIKILSESLLFFLAHTLLLSCHALQVYKT